MSAHHRSARAGVAALLVSVAAATVAWSGAAGAAGAPSRATPGAPCVAGALPESTQGRVPLSEVNNGRAAKGYRCNTLQVSHFGDNGGYHVWRYQDRAGHVCAYYDGTVLLGRDIATSALVGGPGVVVLDMTNPAQPVRTAVLSTPAMLQPHESLRLNAKRGLLVAVAGSPATAPGVLDVYDVTVDCRTPVLRSTSPLGVLGHESGFAPDGRTYWAASYLSNGQATLQAIDLTNPAQPTMLLLSTAYALHGISLSDDGNRLYGADQSLHPGLQILDVSDVQQRRPDPQLHQLSFRSWPDVSIPQVSEPITIKGRAYLMEVDEFANGKTGLVGAARLIDIADVRRPKVVSDLRLRVHDQDAQSGDQRKDLGATAPAQGYTAHYCSVPRRTDPNLVACSFILSGLRIFDIRNPLQVVEVGYFNPQTLPATNETAPATRAGSFAMSGPAWDLTHGQVWYSDANKGFYAVQLVGAAGAALRGTSPVSR